MYTAAQNRDIACGNASRCGVAAITDSDWPLMMLTSEALDRISRARERMQSGAYEAKSRLLHSAEQIIAQLRSSLDLLAEDEMAVNLDDMYEYVSRRLVRADLANEVEPLDEVTHLLRAIRSTWMTLYPHV